MQISHIMSALLLTIFGVTALQQCPMWREIAPCTCRRDTKQVSSVTCDKMRSFNQSLELLRGHFSPTDRVSLRISASNLTDIQYHRLNELNMTIENLKLNHDYIGDINEDTFEGLTNVNYLSMADTPLKSVPEELWKKMPNLKTVDLGRTRIKEISDTNFRELRQLECLVLPGNQISRLDRNSLPHTLTKIHLGRNHIRDLNGTLRHMTDLTWLFINSNGLSSMENELPVEAPHFQLLHASNNMIKKLPQQLRNCPAIESMFFQDNMLTSLDGAVAKNRNMLRLVLDYNYIESIAADDFQELEMLETLLLGHNKIRSLNNSLLPLRKLTFLNLTYNYLQEFSFQDIMGLQELRSIDLSFNEIKILLGPATNIIDWNIKLTELKLDNNQIELLNGALSGFPELLRLNLSHNKLRKISPDDFIGLDELRLLDISHNQLTTLEETSKTFLPRLSELKASDNYLTVLEKDFHGLPVLCNVDLSNNQIVALGRDLVTKSRCKIEHDVYEGSWDTLKINLQDNPILCDAALPEIMSSMEINHTRIFGVSHCPPLDEQPTTSKPNAFLGYLPDETLAAKNGHVLFNNKPPFDPKPHSDIDLLDPPNQIHREPSIELRAAEQYRVDNDSVKKSTSFLNDQPVVAVNLRNGSLIDPVAQGQQITKLASEIEELRSRLDQLSTQNELLLNKTILERSVAHQRALYEVDEARKP